MGRCGPDGRGDRRGGGRLPRPGALQHGRIEIGYQWRPQDGASGPTSCSPCRTPARRSTGHRAFVRVRSSGHASAAPEPHLDPATMRDRLRAPGDRGRAGRARARGGERRGHALRGRGLLRPARRPRRSSARSDGLAVALARSDSREVFLEMRGPGRSGTRQLRRARPLRGPHDLCWRAEGCDALSARSARGGRRARRARALHDRVLGMEGYPGFRPGKNGVFIVPRRRNPPLARVRALSRRSGPGQVLRALGVPARRRARRQTASSRTGSAPRPLVRREDEAGGSNGWRW